MPKRTVKTGLATYRNASGQSGCVAFRGDEVDVHADDVERFDSLNEQPGGDEPFDSGREAVNVYTSPGASNSGTGSGLNTTVDDDGGDGDAEPAEPKTTRSRKK